jgi:hypothetical protein
MCEGKWLDFCVNANFFFCLRFKQVMPYCLMKSSLVIAFFPFILAHHIALCLSYICFWSMKACDIRGAKKDGYTMESRLCFPCVGSPSSPLAEYEVNGRRLSPPPRAVCIIT